MCEEACACVLHSLFLFPLLALSRRIPPPHPHTHAHTHTQVSRAEFANALTRLGVNVDANTMNAMLDEADKDGSDSLSLPEFVDMIRRMRIVESQNNSTHGSYNYPVNGMATSNKNDLVFSKQANVASTTAAAAPAAPIATQASQPVFHDPFAPGAVQYAPAWNDPGAMTFPSSFGQQPVYPSY